MMNNYTVNIIRPTVFQFGVPSIYAPQSSVCGQYCLCGISKPHLSNPVPPSEVHPKPSMGVQLRKNASVQPYCKKLDTTSCQYPEENSEPQISPLKDSILVTVSVEKFKLLYITRDYFRKIIVLSFNDRYFRSRKSPAHPSPRISKKARNPFKRSQSWKRSRKERS